MSSTTPPRPFDITALFRQLAPLACTATRLHPRPGSPTVHDSSVGVGGPLPWPTDEPWPYPNPPGCPCRAITSSEDASAARPVRRAVFGVRGCARCGAALRADTVGFVVLPRGGDCGGSGPSAFAPLG